MYVLFDLGLSLLCRPLWRRAVAAGLTG